MFISAVWLFILNEPALIELLKRINELLFQYPMETIEKITTLCKAPYSCQRNELIPPPFTIFDRLSSLILCNSFRESDCQLFRIHIEEGTTISCRCSCQALIGVTLCCQSDPIDFTRKLPFTQPRIIVALSYNSSNRP